MFSRLFPTEKTDPELAPFRSGLLFGFFNALTWQIAIGTPMVLFAESLGASPAQVGLAYSFVFLLTPIQVVATAFVPRFGFKRVTLAGWGSRSLFLVVPLVLTALAPRLGVRGWMVHALIWSVFLFCFCRSIGASSMVSWLYGLLPENARGRYFANDQFLSGIAGVGTLLVSAALFACLPIYPALLLQYGIASVGSTLSFVMLRKLPDVPAPGPISLWAVLRGTPRHMFGASVFRSYLWLAVGYYVLSTPVAPFVAYYLKVGPRLSAGQIMVFEVFRYTGVIVAAWTIRRKIDQAGARPFLLLALGLYALVAVFWWVFLHGGHGGLAAIAVAYFTVGLGATCWTVANLNYLPKVCADQERALMVSIHGAVTTCLGGCSPVVWGWLMKTSGAAGPGIDAAVFGWFFVYVLVSATVLSALVARLPEDTETVVEPLVIGNAVLRPVRAAAYLVNLFDLPRPGRPARPTAERK